MQGNIIRDIRIYKSDIPNIDGNSLPKEFACKSVNIIINRIVMKLRENEFSLGDFHHLYINFTDCLNDGQCEKAKRSIDKYYKWFRYYDYGVSSEVLDKLCTDEGFIIDCIVNVLENFFADTQNKKDIIRSSVNEALTQGENMLCRYKEKESSTNKAVIYLRLDNNGNYIAVIRVYNKADNTMILNKEMMIEYGDFSSLGQINLSKNKITIKPRKNSVTEYYNIQSVTFEF